ncbi:MAG: Stp1/IreP family PP2C-type Ser/Thr phosphatase [Sulfuricaulis sp.]
MNELLMAGMTDTGRVRNQNEDSIAVVPEAGLAVVADGMGGHQAGEVASKLAVEVITRHMIDVLTGTAAKGETGMELKSVGDAIQLANRAVYDLARERPEYNGMGSTVVMTVFHGDKICVGHVGDSRLYRFRDGLLEQVTQDHSVVQELVSRGLVTAEEARQSVNKNLVTRALGVDPGVTPDVSEHLLQNEDIYLLCSDGLNDVLADGDIEMMLIEHRRQLDDAVQHMIDMANERGGPDNISVILIRTGQVFEQNREALELLRNQV